MFVLLPSLLGCWGNYLTLCERVMNDDEWRNHAGTEKYILSWDHL